MPPTDTVCVTIGCLQYNCTAYHHMYRYFYVSYTDSNISMKKVLITKYKFTINKHAKRLYILRPIWAVNRDIPLNKSIASNSMSPFLQFVRSYFQNSVKLWNPSLFADTYVLLMKYSAWINEPVYIDFAESHCVISCHLVSHSSQRNVLWMAYHTAE